MLKVVAGIAAVFGGLALWWCWIEGPLRDPAAALADFHTGTDRAEDQLTDPLILNGRRVVPLVLAELPDKNMDKRRYAIGFLGVGGYAEALPALQGILSDESELNYFRADALEAIQLISPEDAKEVASRYVDADELLGDVAKNVVAGHAPMYTDRSWWHAFLHWHD